MRLPRKDNPDRETGPGFFVAPMKPKYPPTKAIFVDVDGTLIGGSSINHPLIAWIDERKADGFSLTLWSARGERYARQVADRLQVTDRFDHIIAKPGYIVDDQGWFWIKHTQTIDLSTIN